jgi:hypothetical protein
MRKFILSAGVALALALGFAATKASAAWVTGPVTYYDPGLGQNVTTTQTYWVPDEPVVTSPTYITPGPIIVHGWDHHHDQDHHWEFHGRHEGHRR